MSIEEEETEQKGIVRVKLSDRHDLVVSLVDNEKLDLRIFIETDGCIGRQGEN